jgi:hypothetical protein
MHGRVSAQPVLERVAIIQLNETHGYRTGRA